MNETPSILIVDDEPVNVTILERMLREAGFSTLSAGDGVQGRALAASRRPDLIILDIMMPHENGFETCRQILADPLTADIPIIFISGLADVDAKVKGLKMGAVDYVTKPFALVEVLARVKLHIRMRRAARAVIQEQAARLQQIRDAQRSILTRPEDLPEADFAVNYVPILEAGGDFYDVYRITDAEIGYFVADISGHDLRASFVTSSLKALLRQNSGPLFTPLETIKTLNSVLGALFKDGRHLTAALIALNRKRRRMTLINAGHPAPLVLRADGEVEALATEGDVLGVFETITLGVLEREIVSGERIFLYTDGLVERFEGEGVGRAAGMEALATHCRETRRLPLAQAVDQIMERLDLGGGKADDDLLLMGVEV